MSSKTSKQEPGKKKAIKKADLKATEDRKQLWIGAIVISILTLLVYLPVFSNGFVNWDDEAYIQNEPLIRTLNPGAFFSQFFLSNYQPLVMMVYAIAYHLSGLNPEGYHFISLLFHIANSILVLWLIYRLTGSFQVSFIVGLLFGIHPLHVESVAWASELKDLMYSFGLIVSLNYYIRYVKENNTRKFYILSLAFFLFSILSKGMGVSLTAILFLVDFYLDRKITAKTFIEKVPFVVLSVIFGAIAIIGQKSAGSIQDIATFTFLQRIVFACYGFIVYIVRLFVPLHLSAYYPYPATTGGVIPAYYYIFPLILIAVLVAIFYSLKNNRKIFFGTGFFAVTVFFVLQLLPVGNTITADRYTYIPSIGIFYLLAEALVYLSSRDKPVLYGFSRMSLALLTGFILFFSFITYNRVKIWNDGVSLWDNVIENYDNVAVIYSNRGVVYEGRGELDKAISDFSRSLQLDSTSSETWNNKGTISFLKDKTDSARTGRFLAEAIHDFDKAIQINPKYANAYTNRGRTLFFMRKLEDALKDLNYSVQLNPASGYTYYNRGLVYYNLGNRNDACVDLQQSESLGFAQATDAINHICR